MYEKRYWYGKEVEGRLSDMETVFVRSEVPTNYIEYPHVYFTIEYITHAVNSPVLWDRIYQILDNSNKMITIEANDRVIDSIPMSVFNRVHIIYRIQDANVAKLKKTDTLSIDAGWYRCLQVTKHNMMETDPDTYKFDRIKE
jgi:hypothetical protein